MPKDIKALAGKHGSRKVQKWNLSQLLTDLGGQVARYEDGWEITEHGQRTLADLGLSDAAPTKSVQVRLREYAQKLSNDQTRAFVEESVRALEYGLLRSAVVLSWVGAVAVLHQDVIDNHLPTFDAEFRRRNPKGKPIKKLDDLHALREYDFLQIARAIGLFGKNVKEELEVCLKLRNSCGHPSGLRIGDHGFYPDTTDG